MTKRLRVLRTSESKSLRWSDAAYIILSACLCGEALLCSRVQQKCALSTKKNALGLQKSAKMHIEEMKDIFLKKKNMKRIA